MQNWNESTNGARGTMDGWMDGRTDGRTNGRMDSGGRVGRRQVDGWMDPSLSLHTRAVKWYP
eukprot:357588-Chlamydomonas_euryale.AAC.4